MSVSASLDLRIVDRSSGKLTSPLLIIQRLLIYGWNIERNGNISYLPIGDNDDFNWTFHTLGVPSLIEILKEKEKLGEMIGLGIFWQDTYRGGSLLIWSEEEMKKMRSHTFVTFSLSSDRKLIIDKEDLRITDVNWYTTKLLDIFNRDGTFVEYYTYEEHV